MTPIIDWIDRLQQRWRPVAVTVATFKRFSEHNGARSTATIAYWSFFSLFPLLLVFVTILSIVLSDRPETREDLVEGALGQIPVIGTSLADSQSALGGSWLTVAVGVLAAVWSGLAAANALQVSLDEIWDVPRTARPNGALQRLRSIGFLLVLALAVTVSTAAASVDAWIDSAQLVRLSGIAVSLLANGLIVLFAFRVLTSERHPTRALLPGLLVAAGGITLLQVLGTYIVTRYLHGASDVYGTFATVIALLSWIFLLTRVTLMGSELNAVLVHRLWPRTIHVGATPTAGDERSVEFDERRVHRDARFETTVEPTDTDAHDADTDDQRTAADAAER